MITKRLTIDARTAALRSAEGEARRRGDTRVGSDHLLVALVADPHDAAAIGVDHDQAREALERLDAEALHAIGVDPTLTTAVGIEHTRRGRLPLTNGAKQALRRAIRESDQLDESAITVRHLVLAILEAQPPDPAADLLHTSTSTRPPPENHSSRHDHTSDLSWIAPVGSPSADRLSRGSTLDTTPRPHTAADGRVRNHHLVADATSDRR